MYLGIGFALWLISVIWFIYLSVQRNSGTGMKAVWAIVSLLFQPIAGIVFFIVKKDGLIPMLLAIVATIMYGVGGVEAVTQLMQQMK